MVSSWTMRWSACRGSRCGRKESETPHVQYRVSPDGAMRRTPHVLRLAPGVAVDAVEGTDPQRRDDPRLGLLDELGQGAEAEPEARGELPGGVAAVGPVVDGPQVGPGDPAEVDGVEDLGVAGNLGGGLRVEVVPGRPVAQLRRVPLLLVGGKLRDGKLLAAVRQGEPAAERQLLPEGAAPCAGSGRGRAPG